MSAHTLHAIVEANDQDLAIAVSNAISRISNTPVVIKRGEREYYLEWELPSYTTFTQFLYEFQSTEAYKVTNWTTIPIQIDVRQTMSESLDPYQYRVPTEAMDQAKVTFFNQTGGGDDEETGNQQPEIGGTNS